ncbi:hypothetical protein PG990_004245 [Apiospora arundinis]
MLDELVECCSKPQNWPLQHQKDRLFVDDSAKTWVSMREIYTGEEELEKRMIADESELAIHYKQHLNNRENDPRMRHVFLTAAHSAAPLDCTLRIFQYLCTYHQVSPEFLGLISSFGRQNEKWNSFSHTHVLHQLSYNTPYFNMAIPEIGRSGEELRVAYRLYAMEQQEKRLGSKWTMRQTATYHTLDLVKWKAFWITVKANDVIRDRVDEANSVRCGPTKLSRSAEAICRSLAIHQIMFDWCTDGWGWYINHIADEIDGILKPITAAKIPSELDSLDPVPGLVKALSLPPEKRGSHTEKISHLNHPDSLIATRSQEAGIAPGTLPTTRSDQERTAQIENTQAVLKALKNFSFRGVRQLDTYCNKLRDARTAITANVNIASEISDIYKDFGSTTLSPDERDKDCMLAIRQFQDCLRSITHNLKSDCVRIDSILGRLNDGKALYYHILDLQRKELDKLFAMNQHDASQRMQSSSDVMERVTKNMHTIAERTERDTSSMHFITFLTLVFLPGTFLGALFSTPIFGDAPEDGSSTWLLNQDLLFLFLKICLPMMVIFVGLWFAYRKYKRDRSFGKDYQEAKGADMV